MVLRSGSISIFKLRRISVFFPLHPLTLSFQVLTQFSLGFSIRSQTGLWVEFVGHGGGSNYSLQAACAPLGHILLRVEEHYIDFGHVEQSKRHRSTQTH